MKPSLYYLSFQQIRLYSINNNNSIEKKLFLSNIKIILQCNENKKPGEAMVYIFLLLMSCGGSSSLTGTATKSVESTKKQRVRKIEERALYEDDELKSKKEKNKNSSWDSAKAAGKWVSEALPWQDIGEAALKIGTEVAIAAIIL